MYTKEGSFSFNNTTLDDDSLIDVIVAILQAEADEDGEQRVSRFLALLEKLDNEITDSEETIKTVKRLIDAI